LNSRAEHSKSGASAGDIAKYILAVLLVAGGLFAFYWFDSIEGVWQTAGRVLAVVAGIVLGGLVFMSTGKGAETREFLSESRFELRKVIWPTRQEAMRMTVVVFIAVVLISLILAGFDLVIQWLVKLALGA
jgi:preprotein translocase subunit SecE